jgi:ABC-type Fe3+/spermidine/putrescine transport system ATPase subunit
MSLSVKNLFKRYGNEWVLKDVSFDVSEGEVFGIFGPNGSGKTTLLEVIAGTERANGGTIWWRDRNISDIGAEKRDFGFSSRREGGKWFGLFGNRDRSDRVKGLFNALAAAENLLLLDDPFCDLDAEKKAEFIERAREKAAKRLSIILATANYDEIFEFCDRVGVLIEKDIRQIGTPEEVYDRPNSWPAAAVIGRNNIFESRRLTSSKSDHPEFITLEGEHRIFAEKAGIKKLGAINKNVSLAIRPENISISFGASFPEDNLLKSIVTGVKPYGAYTIVELDSNGLKLQAMVLRLVGLNIGEECMIGLPPDKIQILSD